jgi:hypothetical protein
VQQSYVCHQHLVLAAALVAEHSHGAVADLQAQIGHASSLHVLLLLLGCVPCLLLLLLRRRMHHCHMMQRAWGNNANRSRPLGNQP